MHESPWHVLHVIANHEKRVAKQLAVRSLEHYLPLYAESSRWTDRTVLLERPLFTGYVFVRCTSQTRLAFISTPGVISLLGDGKNETVSAVEIARIRYGLASGSLVQPHPYLPVNVGTPVRVLQGAFKGMTGVVMEFRHRCRVILSLAAVQRCFSVEVDLQDIQTIPQPELYPMPMRIPLRVGANHLSM